MPLAAVATAANRQDCSSLAPALDAMVVKMPECEASVQTPEPAAMPGLRGDGGYGYATTRAQAKAHGYRLHAPSRGSVRVKGLGRIRVAVEHGHALFNQFGRIARRLDRHVSKYMNWIELAACLIFIRAGFVP